MSERERRLSKYLRAQDNAGAKPTRYHHVPGVASIAYTPSADVHFLDKEGISVLVAGKVSKWPGFDAVAIAQSRFVSGMEDDGLHLDEATWLHGFYHAFVESSADFEVVLNRTLEAIAVVEGSFSFIICDTAHGRVLAGRSQDGAVPLCWGATPDGLLAFASNNAFLEGCEPSSCDFPGGCMYSSGGGDDGKEEIKLLKG